MDLYFIDLDGVILNTVQLITDFKALLIQNGVPLEKVLEFYTKKKSPIQYRSRTYYLISEPYSVLGLLGINAKKVPGIIEEIENFLGKMENYIFADAADFLKQHQNENLYLVSYGGIGWQNKKVDSANLRQHFKEVIITHGREKSNAISEIIQKTSADPFNCCFFDDQNKEIISVKDAFPEIKTFLIVRPNSKFDYGVCGKHDFKISDLSKAKLLLS